jgi:hypothetical protein
MLDRMKNAERGEGTEERGEERGEGRRVREK